VASRPPDERPAQTFADRTLVAAVRGQSEAAEPTEALRELLRRRSARPPLLAEVVVDRKQPRETRAVAAVALGRQPTPTAKDALITALRDRDPLVQRRAAESLGKIGDEQALKALERLELPRGPARRSVEFAGTLISYRLGLDKHRLRRPPAKDELQVQRRRAQRVAPAPPDPQTLERILTDASRELPSIPLAEQSALRFACGGHEFAIVLTEELEEQHDLAGLGRRNAVVGVVFERSPVEDSYFTLEYLLSNPAPRGPSVYLYGVRPNGVIAHVGELDTGAGATFSLRALNTRYSPPLALDGAYDPAAKQLRMEAMLVQADFDPSQKQPATPTKLEFQVE
jgi:hypothetical protein